MIILLLKIAVRVLFRSLGYAFGRSMLRLSRIGIVDPDLVVLIETMAQEAMTTFEDIDPQIKVQIVPLRQGFEELEWNGEICDSCSGNVYSIPWAVELEYYDESKDLQYFMLVDDFCVECDNVGEIIMHRSAEKVRDYYGHTGGSIREA